MQTSLTGEERSDPNIRQPPTQLEKRKRVTFAIFVKQECSQEFFECLLKDIAFSLLGFFVLHPLSPGYRFHITGFFLICKHQGHPEDKPRWSIRCKFSLAKRILVAGSCDTALSFYLETFRLESNGLKNSHNTLKNSPSVYQSLNSLCSPLW